MVTKETNGATDIDALLAKLEEYQLREVQRLEDELIEKRVEAELARREAERQETPKRSQLTARQKSEIIRERGVEFYNSLPWA